MEGREIIYQERFLIRGRTTIELIYRFESILCSYGGPSNLLSPQRY